ncbi:TSUP family transporter [Streptomyces agglomeratus]|uniref:TSUP family transporter n=1 Tax=Streptomyces agglomeratus TaxID=285458 RepID=UPI000A3F8197|nr:TSUP family transporter [Streptomyces agglomeratus]
MATDNDLAAVRSTHSTPLVFGAGAVVGVLGGLVGLGGAEFRLPLLISLFGFAALSAVILNKAMSLVVVLVALPARLAAVPASEVGAHWPVAINLLAGSLLGAWAGATWAVRMRGSTLHKVLAVLMVFMAAGCWSHTPPPWGRRRCRCGLRCLVASWPGSGSGWSRRSWAWRVASC